MNSLEKYPMQKAISKDDMRNWFLERYVDHAGVIPYESAKGRYLDTAAVDSVDPSKVLLEQFSGRISNVQIEELASELRTQEWIPMIERDDDDEIPDERLDSSKVNIISANPTISNVIERLRNEEIQLSPPYQRNPNLWTPRQQSALIESILLKFPLPAFYFDVLADDTWLVVDGLQRLSTLRNFIIGQQTTDGLRTDDETFRLKDLEFLKELEGVDFKNLRREHQRRINETQLTAFFIQAGTPNSVKCNLFKRLNTGGLILNSQEIRRAIFQGRASEFVSRLAQSKEFVTATVGGVSSRRLENEDFTTRFLAFYIRGYETYTKGMERVLTDTLEMIQSKDVSDQQLEGAHENFKKALCAINQIFDKQAFRKPQKDGQKRREPVNKALFEIWTVLLAKLTDTERATLVAKSEQVKQSFFKLLEDTKFNDSISHNTSHTDTVNTRFSRLHALLRDILNGDTDD